MYALGSSQRRVASNDLFTAWKIKQLRGIANDSLTELDQKRVRVLVKSGMKQQAFELIQQKMIYSGWERSYVDVNGSRRVIFYSMDVLRWLATGEA